MEAWILHISSSYVPEDDITNFINTYSAWACEKQALIEACKWIQKNKIHIEYNLYSMFEVMFNLDKMAEATKLVSLYSKSISKGRHLQININITKSTFKGSPFE